MIETGLILAFIVAMMKGLQSVYQRKDALDTDEFVTAFSSRMFGIPVLIAALFYTGIPDLSVRFFMLAIPLGAVTAFASVLIAKAYKESDASIVTPMFAVSPILVLFTSFIMLGEVPDVMGGVGVFLIAIGAYALKLDESTSPLEPLKRLWDEKGVRIIMVVILLYSVTANIDKIGVQMSSPVMWPLATYTISSVFMLPLMMKKSPQWKSKIKKEWKPLGLLGLLGGAAIILQMAALELTLVSYVISIKRLSIPIAVAFSYFMLGEKSGFKDRMIGSLLMVAGVLLISI